MTVKTIRQVTKSYFSICFYPILTHELLLSANSPRAAALLPYSHMHHFAHKWSTSVAGVKCGSCLTVHNESTELDHTATWGRGDLVWKLSLSRALFLEEIATDFHWLQNHSGNSLRIKIKIKKNRQPATDTHISTTVSQWNIFPSEKCNSVKHERH